MKRLFFILLLVMNSLFSYAQSEQKNDEWKFSGLTHILTQLDGKDFSNQTYPLSYTTMKLRLGVEKSVFDQLYFRVDIQDSRVMGSEKGYLNNNKNLDLLQGYIELKKLFDVPLSLQAGRFQMNYGTGRFIGEMFWHYYQSSFDGFRVRYAGESFSADYYHIVGLNSVFKNIKGTAADYYIKINPQQYPYPAYSDSSLGLYGAWLTKKFGKDHKVDLFSYLEYSWSRSDCNCPDLNRLTSGFNYIASLGSFSAAVEAAYQTGGQNFIPAGGTATDKVNKNISAYTTNLKLGWKLDAAEINAGYEMISGTDPAETKKVNTFTFLLANAHQYFGLMDYFLDVQLGTAGLGVNDIFIGGTYKFIPNKLLGTLTAHQFNSNKTLLSMNNFGQEIDLVLDYEFIKGVKIQGGGGFFLPSDLMKYLYRVKDPLDPQKFIERKDIAFWTYLMTVVKL